MKTSHWIIFGTTAVAAVAVSALLIPSAQDSARINLRGGNTEKARTQLEAELAQSGELTTALARDLSEVYLQENNIEKAVYVMDSFVKKHPQDKQATERLASLQTMLPKPAAEPTPLLPAAEPAKLAEIAPLPSLPPIEVKNNIPAVTNIVPTAQPVKLTPLKNKTKPNNNLPKKPDYNSLAYQMLEHGDKNKAVAMFEVMAKGSQPGSAKIKQLLFAVAQLPSAQAISWIEARPLLLKDKGVRDWYAEQLGKSPDFPEHFSKLLPKAKADKNYAAILARAANSGGYDKQSAQILDIQAKLEPENPLPLRQLAMNAWQIGDYTAAKIYLEEAVHSKGSDPEKWRSFFYLAEIYRREGAGKDTDYYQKSLQEIKPISTITADVVSAKARSLLWIGEASAGIKIFDEGLKQFPKDENLRADYIATLIELKQYKPAIALFPQEISADVNMQIRYKLLGARIALETGHAQDATDRLTELEAETNYRNSEVMGYAASAAWYVGNSENALRKIAQAKALALHNEDISKLARDIERNTAPHVLADEEWINRSGGVQERVDTIGFSAAINDKIDVGVTGQNRLIDTRERKKQNQQSAEIYGQIMLNDERWLRAALYANERTLGAGLDYNFLNSLGTTKITAELRRPYFELPQASLQNITRDRIALTQRWQPSNDWDIKGSVGLNNYGIDDEDNAYSATSVDASIVRRIFDSPYVGIGYGLNAEYKAHKAKKADGTPQVNLQTREIHAVALSSSYEINQNLLAEGLAGYAVDRFGGNGPLVEGKLTHTIAENWDISTHAGYGFDNNNGGGDVARFGISLRRRF